MADSTGAKQPTGTAAPGGAAAAAITPRRSTLLRWLDLLSMPALA